LVGERERANTAASALTVLDQELHLQKLRNDTFEVRCEFQKREEVRMCAEDDWERVIVQKERERERKKEILTGFTRA